MESIKVRAITKLFTLYRGAVCLQTFVSAIHRRSFPGSGAMPDLVCVTFNNIWEMQ